MPKDLPCVSETREQEGVSTCLRRKSIPLIQNLLVSILLIEQLKAASVTVTFLFCNAASDNTILSADFFFHYHKIILIDFF